MSHRYTNIYRIFFLLTDLIALNLVLLVLLSRLADHSNLALKSYIILNLSCNIFWLISSYLTAAYIIYKNLNIRQLCRRTTISFILFCSAIVLFSLLSNAQFDLFLIACIIGGFGACLLISRLTLISYVLYTRTNRKFDQKVVIIGCNETSRSLTGLLYSSQRAIRFQGYFDYTGTDPERQDFLYLGDVKDCLGYAINNNVNLIYCTLSPEDSSELYKLAEEAEKNFIKFWFVPNLHNFIQRKFYIDFIDQMPILSLRAKPMEDETAQVKKRLFDIIVSSVILLMLLSWLLPILAILIRLDSKGPVFFSQKRTGKNNKEFTCLKLRSLKTHDHPDHAAEQVTENDHRLTKVGKFLRRSNLDELPQFFNVLMGDMSIVGARPHMLKHTIDFANMDDRYMIRHLCKPGVTGWAQVNGYRGEIKKIGQLRKRIDYDTWYIENWNLLLDIKIILSTIYLTIKGDKNAY